MKIKCSPKGDGINQEDEEVHGSYAGPYCHSSVETMFTGTSQKHVIPACELIKGGRNCDVGKYSLGGKLLSLNAHHMTPPPSFT